MEAALDDSMIVPGDQHHQMRCPACDDVVRRPSSGREHASPAAEPVAVHPAPPLSAPSEPDSGVDECEILLRRAIEMVRGAARRSPPTMSPTEGGTDASAGSAGSLPLHCAPPASILPETDGDLDECEVLLGRAIEMVRGPAHRTPPRTGIADRWPGARGDLAAPMRAKASGAKGSGTKGPGTSRMVRIHHDPQEAAYIARDIGSGLSVLRHQDGARLRAMCERIGWQVADGGRLKEPSKELPQEPPKSDD